MLLLFLLQLTFFFLSNVTALSITVQPDTIVGQPSLVLWAREPSDGNGLLVFDLRFVKPDNEDVGLALANIVAQPSTEFGTVQVVFPSSGSYLLVAVSGSADLTDLGQSNQVNAFQVSTTSTSIPTSTSQPVPSATSSSATPTSATASGAGGKKNLGAIIGGTLGGVAFLGLVAALVFLYLRRRRQPAGNKRWTFYRDKMVLPPVLDIHRTSPMNSQFFSSQEEDIEQQGREEGLPHDDIITTIPTSPTVMMASSSGPRPLLKSSSSSPLPPLHDRPLPAVPPRSHQEDIADQMEQIRYRITELEKSPGPTQRIILDDLQEQMVWLKSQI
jgi:hypothetical protein